MCVVQTTCESTSRLIPILPQPIGVARENYPKTLFFSNFLRLGSKCPQPSQTDRREGVAALERTRFAGGDRTTTAQPTAPDGREVENLYPPSAVACRVRRRHPAQAVGSRP